ncbi:MAG: Plasmid-derived single-stranded DNA-binding protein [Candidatus Anoxychlamydiales bacterium]|nr:Plasmid-derived single-stranded DNA-binding protein [Candidatus Anoxychlamydiales bacterium]
MNIITIAGRLGVDPEVRFTSNGQKVTTLRVAVNVRKSGKEDTIWYRVTVWGENFDKMISFLKKGSALIVVGDLAKPEIFDNREGKPQVSMNITASSLMFSPFGRSDKTTESPAASVEKPSSNSQSAPASEEFAAYAAGEKKQDSSSTEEFSDDEIPF